MEIGEMITIMADTPVKENAIWPPEHRSGGLLVIDDLTGYLAFMPDRSNIKYVAAWHDVRVKERE